jgi:GT2 family glycosyltransferase
MINILQLPANSFRDATLTSDGIVLHRPWGSVRFNEISLSTGWYKLSVSDPAASICLQLKEDRTHDLIELSAKGGAPAYFYIRAGSYQPEVFSGVRPISYVLGQVQIAPLPDSERYRLFARRALNALMGGVSVSILLGLAKRALNPKYTFGIQTGSTRRQIMGVLTSADRENKANQVFVTPPSNGPCFLVRYADSLLSPKDTILCGLQGQTYRTFTIDPDISHEATLYISKGQRLTVDALSLFAAYLNDNPRSSVIIADAWEEGQTTARVAFDPLLYSHGSYPTPYVVRSGFVPVTGSWTRAEPLFSVISVPLASGPALQAIDAPRSVPVMGNRPLVSIIIPTRDRADLLETCLNGLFDATPWPHEVIIVDNGSTEAATFALFDLYRAKGATVLRADIPFNFSTLCNLGAAEAKGSYLVFMNNDIQLTRSDWLEHMMHFAVHEDVGAVGARLLYPDKSLQHAGVALGLSGSCGHLWRGLSYEEQEGVERIKNSSLRAAVTGALLCVERDKFDSVGGFDELNYPVTLNDIDLCLKLYSRGWYTVYAAQAEAIHAEGLSRGPDEDADKAQRRHAELTAFSEQWEGLIVEDPWLPVSVMRSTEIFGLK